MTSLLAQGPGSPSGNTDIGLELNVKLTAQSHLDTHAYEADPRPWPVRRYWPDQPEWHGGLVALEEGWALCSKDSGDNAPLWALGARVFRPGEYITLRRPDGEELVFRIVNVEQD
ncbi:MAG: hypothetical protein JO110_19425 [Acetobacteraceae bacterium]|nr:hypothetical protein [Acetobacteraceae bacterium]